MWNGERKAAVACRSIHFTLTQQPCLPFHAPPLLPFTPRATALRASAGFARQSEGLLRAQSGYARRYGQAAAARGWHPKDAPRLVALPLRGVARLLSRGGADEVGGEVVLLSKRLVPRNAWGCDPSVANATAPLKGAPRLPRLDAMIVSCAAATIPFPLALPTNPGLSHNKSPPSAATLGLLHQFGQVPRGVGFLLFPGGLTSAGL